MRKEKVISSYAGLSDYELSTLAGRILKAMKEPSTQANFPKPNPEITVLEPLVNDYITKHEIASRRGSALEISQKNESREALLNALRTLAHYVNEIANGQLSLLLSTGMMLAIQPGTVQAPTTVEQVQLRDGRISGQLRLDFKAVKGVWEYEVALGIMEANGEINWDRTVLTTSSRSNVLTEIEPGIRYAVRVRARNGKGTSDWCEPVTLIAR
ncbi:MAG: fibronectin type III domain-containing protein [Sphingobacterium sp.]|jgi:hypothetical protein|nr:fibronectin type III domain-containing protein [Sphingobacterium sp.]